MKTQNGQETYFITGALGCIGAWTLYHLVKDGKRAICFDISDNRHRLNLLLAPEEQDQIIFIHGDLTDFDQVLATLQDQKVTHVIHLAALQVPFCKADPVRGAQVNVLGTANIFEACRQAGLKHLTYASSIAVYGPPEGYPDTLIPHDAPFDPRTLYGVYKVANESTAKIFWQDHEISSTALRPYIVYGPGRDQGMTSDPTKAMLAAAAGDPFHINFDGNYQYHFASDVALQFIDAAQRPLEGAYSFNLGTAPASMVEIVEMIKKIKPEAAITFTETTLPFPLCDGRAFQEHFSHVPVTPLEDGIRQTIEHFEACLNDGRMDRPD